MAKTTVLDAQAITESVYRRLDGGKVFEGRDAYFGASEEGRCSRRVVFDKIFPQPASQKFSLASAWKVNLGRVMENEVIQVLRGAGVELRETGNSQLEVKHPTMPFFRCHPDGRVLAPFYHFGLEDGDGGLEVKNTADYIAKKWLKDGLGEDYLSQANDQMGLRGQKWCLFIAVWRESIKGGEDLVVPWMAGWIIDYDADKFAKSEARVVAMETARLAIIKARVRSEEVGEEFPRESIDAMLPEGEPARGYCASCPLAPTCKGYLNSAPDCPTGEALPAEAVLELEVILEELGDLREDWAPLDKRIKDLTVQAKPLIPTNEKRKFVLEGGEVVVGMSQVSAFTEAAFKAAVMTKYSTPGDAAIAAGVLEILASEQAKKKNQPTISLKPRRAE